MNGHCGVMPTPEGSTDRTDGTLHPVAAPASGTAAGKAAAAPAPAMASATPSAPASDGLLEERRGQVHRAGQGPIDLACNRESLAGAVSQRACVFCGSRVVLYPIADALHLVHGPVGCAAYTWDIRGALSSGPELHRLSFSTDLGERDIIFGGEPKLEAALDELITRHAPKAAFVYATCIVGLIGDDIGAVCKRVAARHGIPVLPVQSEGFKGNKREGYEAACAAMFTLTGTGATDGIGPASVNILGDFNLAGELWIIRGYLERMGVQVVANITGDGRVDDLRRCHGAALNLVQCSGATMPLARMMREAYGTPTLRVSYLGIEDMADSLYNVAEHFREVCPGIVERTRDLVREEIATLMPRLRQLRRDLEGKRAAIYVGGAFKAFSLIKAFRHLGMQVALVGSQTGTDEDYRELEAICDPGTVIVDDANALELAHFVRTLDVDIFVGGVKERPIAHKLGIGFCDHNHERKIALAGFEGMYNFAREVHASVTSPVWRFTPRSRFPAAARPAGDEDADCPEGDGQADNPADRADRHLGADATAHERDGHPANPAGDGDADCPANPAGHAPHDLFTEGNATEGGAHHGRP